MAQTYDIYLNKRLDELDIIIRNLPFRDGLVANTKMYLTAVVNYLLLQKYIAGKNDMQLLARIDGLLETVYEKFDSKMILDFTAEASAVAPIHAASRVYLETPKLDIQEESFNTFSNFVYLTTAAMRYDLAKSLGSGSSTMVLSTSAADTIKTGFEKFSGEMILSAEAETSAAKTISGSSKMVLSTSQFDIFYLVTIQCEALMNLTCAADISTWYSLHGLDEKLVLTVHNSDVHSEKFCDATTFMRLLAEVNETLICFIRTNGSEMQFSVSAAGDLKRYRKLYEIDNEALEDLDDMTLEELDYVFLT